jgi:flagellar biosynthesis chaperone FliJ
MSKQMLDEHFLTLNVTVTLYPEPKTVSFKTIEKFLEFITKEKEIWQSVYSDVSSRFQSIENQVNTSLQYADSNLEHAKSQIQQAITSANQSQWPTIYSRTSVAQYIKKQFQVSPTLGEAAIQYLLKRQLGNINSYEYFKGYMNSYIFEESAKAFNESAATQEATLSELHKDYIGQLNSLNEDYYRITTDWKSEFENKVSAWKSESEEFKSTTTLWRETIEIETKEELDNTISELDSIKKKYTEHLRLEGPAKYWEQLETSYNISGDKWRSWAVWATVIFIALLTLILLIHPDSKFITNGIFDVNSLRNALIFTIITSISIYIITLFVKLSVSSYHLARDAKERYQITHVYLSLLNENENAIKDAERITVLQSIFSRADTGLLKGDSGPTVPDSLSQIIKLIKR